MAFIKNVTFTGLGLNISHNTASKVVQISGRNRAGKTTLLSLLNVAPMSSSLVNSTYPKASLELEVAHNGIDYTIRQWRTKSTFKASIINQDGEELVKNGLLSSYRSVVSDIGLDADDSLIINKTRKILYSMKPKEALDYLLEYIPNIETIQKFSTTSSKFAKEYTIRVKQLTEDILDDDTYQEYKDALLSNENKLKSYLDINEQHNTLRIKMSATEVDEQKLLIIEKTINGMSLEEAKSRIDVDDKLAEYVGRIKDLDAEIKRRNTILSNYESAVKYERLYNLLYEETEESCGEIISAIKYLQSRGDKPYPTYDATLIPSIKEQIKVTEAELEELNSLFARLKSEHTTTKKLITEAESITNDCITITGSCIDNLKQKLQDNIAEGKVARTDKNKHTTLLRELKEQLDDAEYKAKVYNSFFTRVENLIKFAPLESEVINMLKYIVKPQSKASDVQTYHRCVTAKEQLDNNVSDTVSGLRAEQKEVRHNYSELVDQKRKALKVIESISLQEELLEKQEKYRKLYEEKSKLHHKINREAIAEVKERIARLTFTLELSDNNKKTIADRDYYNKIDTLLSMSKATGARFQESLIKTHIQVKINEINKLLKIFVDDLKVELTVNPTSREKIQFRFISQGSEVKFENLSGFETSVVIIATTVAFDGTSDIIRIDEIDSEFDERHRQLFSTMITKLSERYSQLFVISHNVVIDNSIQVRL